MQFPTGGTAHEPQGMIRCDSEADSIVWMKEDDSAEQGDCFASMEATLGCVYIPEFCFYTRILVRLSIK